MKRSKWIVETRLMVDVGTKEDKKAIFSKWHKCLVLLIVLLNSFLFEFLSLVTHMQ